jgi:DinB superfamily
MSNTSIAISHDLTSRVLQEGYGSEAWHGPELKAALADITPELAFWRPGEGRHNIAEVALHHAYCVRSVREKLSGRAPEAFVLDGEDWFALSAGGALSWPEIAAVIDNEQQQLATLVADLSSGRTRGPLADADRFALVLGTTCHAVYHAGQIQLIKKLAAARS